jgi:hypothetical protein
MVTLGEQARAGGRTSRARKSCGQWRRARPGFINVAHDLGRCDTDTDDRAFLKKEKRLFQFVQEHLVL